MIARLYKGTTSTLSLNDVADSNGSAVTSATVGATIYDRLGVEVGGQAWPLALSHVADGDYSAQLPADLEIEVGVTYLIEIIAETPGGLQATFRTKALCAYAGQDC